MLAGEHGGERGRSAGLNPGWTDTEVDEDRIDEAMLWLTLHDEVRSWKNHD